MSDGSELEVKLAITDTRLFDVIMEDAAIRAMAEGIQPITRSFEALYFDTPNFSLQQHGFAYRIRHEGEKWVATVKCDSGTNGGFSIREEWNEEVRGPEPDLHLFDGTNVGERLAAAMGNEKLQLLFSTRFSRNALLLKTANGSQVELALDRGTIWNGLKGTPISELELELKSGDTSELLHLAGEFSGRWHLLPEPKSKFARGLDLLQADVPTPSALFASPPRQEMAEPTAIALVNVCVANISTCADRLLTQEASPETVRELRIQLRRLRSLLKFFQPILSKEKGKIHSEQLKQWGGLLGSIRDIDVISSGWKKFTTRFAPVFSLSSQWIDVLLERRSFLADDILYRISQGSLTQQLFELQSRLYQEQEKRSADGVELSADSTVRKAFLQAVKQLRDEIQAIEGTIEMKALHQFRIRAKLLRYVQESLNAIARYQDEEFTQALKKVQSHIGKIHDTYQMKSLLEKFDAGSVDDRFLLEKELFVSWRSRDMAEQLSSLSSVLESLRHSAKLRTRTLTALRSGKRAQSGQSSGSHEPSE